MDFSIETGDLQRAIKLLSVTAKMNTIDSSGLILIEASEDGKVNFLSNNNSTALSFTSDKVEVRIPGAAVIEYSKIKSFISAFRKWNDGYGVKDFKFNLSDHFLNISLSNTHENGKVSKGNLKLKVYDLHSVHRPPKFGEPNFILHSNIFKTATNKILYAIDPNAKKAALQGMNVIFKQDDISFVATDGKRLSEYIVKNVSDLKKGEFLLKYDFIMGLRRIVDVEHQLAFEFDERNVKVAFDSIIFWGITIIGNTFPDYKPVLGNYEHSIVVDKDVLMASLLPFVDILNPDDNYRLTFSLSKGTMLLRCDVAEFTYDGQVDFEDDFIIDVQGQHMIQTIEVIRDDKILLRFSDEDGVLIFDSENFKDQAALITSIRRR